MPQSHSKVWLHLVFSTKSRKNYLQRDDFRDQMFRMLAYHVKEHHCDVVKVGGYHDHAHVVCGLNRTLSIAKLVEGIKVETSKWAKSVPAGIGTFSWQEGYGVFSVSHSHLDRVVDYVARQDEHHRQRSYQDEFRELCSRHEIELDDRYVWD